MSPLLTDTVYARVSRAHLAIVFTAKYSLSKIVLSEAVLRRRCADMYLYTRLVRLFVHCRLKKWDYRRLVQQQLLDHPFLVEIW
jgi:hypothetical protein